MVFPTFSRVFIGTYEPMSNPDILNFCYVCFSLTSQDLYGGDTGGYDDMDDFM